MSRRFLVLFLFFFVASVALLVLLVGRHGTYRSLTYRPDGRDEKIVSLAAMTVGEAYELGVVPLLTPRDVQERIEALTLEAERANTALFRTAWEATDVEISGYPFDLELLTHLYVIYDNTFRELNYTMSADLTPHHRRDRTDENGNVSVMLQFESSGIRPLAVPDFAIGVLPISRYDEIVEWYGMVNSLYTESFLELSTYEKDLRLSLVELREQTALLEGEGIQREWDRLRIRLHLEALRLRAGVKTLWTHNNLVNCERYLAVNVITPATIWRNVSFGESELVSSIGDNGEVLAIAKGKLASLHEKADARRTEVLELEALLLGEGLTKRSAAQLRALSLKELIDTFQPFEENASAHAAYIYARASELGCKLEIFCLRSEMAMRDRENELWLDRFNVFHRRLARRAFWSVREGAELYFNNREREAEYIRRSIGRVQACSNALAKKMLRSIPSVAGQLSQVEEILSDGRTMLNSLSQSIDRSRMLAAAVFDEAGLMIDTVRMAQKVAIDIVDGIRSFERKVLWRGTDGSIVTVRDLFLALLLGVLGYFASKLFSRLTGRFFRSSLEIDEVATSSVEVLSFYLYLVIFLILVLYSVNIPLTSFAFMGGALALSIGLGTQIILRNMISGFVIMFARSIKPGDIIELDGHMGRVWEVGARSTGIRRFDGVEVLVPNSYFLENKILKHPRSMSGRQFSFIVETPATSSDRDVEQVLSQAALSNEFIRHDPSPYAAIKKFDQVSVVFELFFGIEPTSENVAEVQDRLKRAILKLSQERNLTLHIK